MKCPYCAEEIKDEAAKCRFCGEWLTADGAKPAVEAAEPTEPGSYDVVLFDAGDNSIGLTRRVIDLTSCTLTDAKMLVISVPSVVAAGVDQASAVRIQAALLTGSSTADVRVVPHSEHAVAPVPRVTKSRSTPSSVKQASSGSRLAARAEDAKLGRPNAAMICPHCQTTGQVRTKHVKVKKGISGGKATAAVFTAGFSMLATGLSRKDEVIQATCGNCGTTWHIA